MMTCVDALAEVSDQSRASLSVRVGRDRLAAGLALAAFAVLCVMSLSFAPKLVEPDDYAYRASIVAVTEGHFLSLSTAQVGALAARWPGPGGGPRILGGRGGLGGIPQWVQLPDGRWISEKDPGYPFLAAPNTWTAQVGGSTLQVVRFYVPALGAIALLGAWFLIRLGAWLTARPPHRVPLALVSAVLVAVTFGLGAWSFTSMRDFPLPGARMVQGGPPPGISPHVGELRSPLMS